MSLAGRACLLHGCPGGLIDAKVWANQYAVESVMHTQSDIENAIRTRLPLAFGKADSAVYTDFHQTFDNIIEYATRFSEPILRAETVRYQSILLYWSLILLILSVFQIGDIKVGDIILKADKRLFIIYSLLLTTVAAVFLIKSYVDYQYRKIYTQKHSIVFDESADSITAAFLKRQIQRHFWLEISSAVDRAYKIYDDALSLTLAKLPDFQPIEIDSGLNISELRSSPELEAEIDYHTQTLYFFKAALAKCEETLKTRIDEILAGPTNTRYERVNCAFNQYLKPWVDARNNLVSAIYQGLKSPEHKQLEVIQAIIKRMARISRVYTLIEIGAPIGFAAGSILYVLLP